MSGLISFCFVAAALSLVSGLPGGPPVTNDGQRTAVCTNLKPASTSPHVAQSGSNKYVVYTDLPINTTVNMYKYTDGGQYTVKIMGNTFRGFLMQARNPMDEAIGTFQTLASTQQLLDCSQAGVNATATIAHMNPTRMDFPYQTFNWTAPTGGNGYVTFRYTLVPQKTEYFGPLRAPPLPPAAPTRNVDAYPVTRRYPDGCVPKDTCEVFVGVAVNAVNDGYLDFYLEGKAGAWVAAGFTETNSMLSADVVVCVYDMPSSMLVGLDTYNSATVRTNILDVVQNIVLFNSTYTSGSIQCTLAKPIMGTTVPAQDLNLNGDYWMLYARGDTGSAQGINGHSMGPSFRKVTARVNPVTGIATPVPTTFTTGAEAVSASLLSVLIASISLFLKL